MCFASASDTEDARPGNLSQKIFARMSPPGRASKVARFEPTAPTHLRVRLRHSATTHRPRNPVLPPPPRLISERLLRNTWHEPCPDERTNGPPLNGLIFRRCPSEMWTVAVRADRLLTCRRRRATWEGSSASHVRSARSAACSPCSPSWPPRAPPAASCAKPDGSPGPARWRPSPAATRGSGTWCKSSLGKRAHDVARPNPDVSWLPKTTARPLERPTLARPARARCGGQRRHRQSRRSPACVGWFSHQARVRSVRLQAKATWCGLQSVARK